jgi:predicted RNA polymerase sigma factor
MILFTFPYLFSVCSSKITVLSKISSFGVLFHKLRLQQDNEKLGCVLAMLYFTFYSTYFKTVGKSNFVLSLSTDSFLFYRNPVHKL